ncbi:MAG TPA: FAD-dependent oxidoreductase [Bacteroidales bacterium]|nr:FAD-dependent oxidoreductase [Bacteroidales bacterium]
MKKVIVLGGGFAGVEAAIRLQKSGFCDVTLVSDRDFLYLYPISIWIPTHGISPDSVKVSLYEIQKKHGFSLIIDSVQNISPKENTILCSKQILTYDYVIIALGANKLSHNGIEHTYSICGKPEISIEIQKTLDAIIQKKQGTIAIGFGGNPKDMSAVRGGPAFEFAFNVHTYLQSKNLRNSIEIHMFAPMKEPGARMGKKALSMVDTMLNKANIHKHFGKKISQFEASKIIFEDNSELQADLIMYIPASQGHTALQNSNLPLNNAGFVIIDDTCKVEGTSNVYAIGDSAAIEGYDWIAKQGHLAELMGRNAAYNIIQSIQNSTKRKGYKEHLNILCVMDTGNGAAFVFRNHKRAFVIPMPIVGHWLKKSWGVYSKLTKLGKIPHLPGM